MYIYTLLSCVIAPMTFSDLKMITLASMNNSPFFPGWLNINNTATATQGEYLSNLYLYTNHWMLGHINHVI